MTLSKPFTRGMKSLVNKIIGPMPLLCQCLLFFFCCVIASGQQQHLIGVDSEPAPHLGGKRDNKKKKKDSKKKITKQDKKKT